MQPSHTIYPVLTPTPEATPLRRHALPVGSGHVIAVQEWGCADGIAAVVLHGGPGSGSSPLLRHAEATVVAAIAAALAAGSQTSDAAHRFLTLCGLG